ncbi:MAG: histidine kinase, partial [Comamonadaceae bacterium]
MPGWRRAALLWLLGCCALVTTAAAQVLTLDHGTVTTTVAGQTRTAALALPYHWDREQAAQPGRARFALPFRLAERPSVPWAVYIPRVGTAFDLRVNGELLRVHGDLARPGGADYAKAPRALVVPARLLQAGDNLIEIELRADTGRRAGLSRVTLGPSDQVLRLHGRDFAIQFTGSVLLVGFSALVGAIALALWLTQVDIAAPGRPRREQLYLWAALAEFFWALRVADGVIISPPLPWVAWGMLMTACYSGWAACAILFCHHVAGWHRSPKVRWLHITLAVMFVGSIVCCWISLTRAEPRWLTGWLAIELLCIGAYIACFLAATLRRPDVARLLVGSAAVLTVGVALRDLLVIRLSDSYGDTTWVRYTSVFFGLALLAIVLRRFRAATAQARDLLGTLAARVADRERELAVTYARLAEAGR